MTKLEQVARAIYELDPAAGQEQDIDHRPIGPPYIVPFEALFEWDEAWYQHVMKLARAAVEAMREPNKAMSTAWQKADDELTAYDADYDGETHWWQGIDAILKEEPK